eukprot:gene9113-10801_t
MGDDPDHGCDEEHPVIAGGAVFVTSNSSVHFEDGGWLDGNNAVQQ